MSKKKRRLTGGIKAKAPSREVLPRAPCPLSIPLKLPPTKQSAKQIANAKNKKKKQKETGRVDGSFQKENFHKKK